MAELVTMREGHPCLIKMETEVKQKLKSSLPSPCTTGQGVTIVTGCPEKQGGRKNKREAPLSPGDPVSTVKSRNLCTSFFSWILVKDIFVFLPKLPGREIEIKTPLQMKGALSKGE